MKVYALKGETLANDYWKLCAYYDRGIASSISHCINRKESSLSQKGKRIAVFCTVACDVGPKTHKCVIGIYFITAELL